MGIMMEFLEEHLNKLRFLTEDEIPKYKRDRKIFHDELYRVEKDEKRGKFESEQEACEEMDRIFDKYARWWVELIDERKKQENEILKR